MSIKQLLIITLLLATSAAAADWVEVGIKYDWNRHALGFCPQTSQCLVNNSYSDTHNNNPDRYWSQLNPSEKPKCIDNGQYISDHYCDNGQWTTRTKLVALQLLALGLDAAPTNFSLYCNSYDKTLNKYNYLNQYGSVTSYLRKFCMQPGNKRLNACANNICVLNYGDNIAFGFSSNTDISGDKSPLNALNLSKTQCDNAKNLDGDYDLCGNYVWYNHDTESIIYSPAAASLPPTTQQTTDFFTVPHDNLETYVFDVVHKPQAAQYNYTFFNYPPHFNKLYIAKQNFRLAYAFKEDRQTPARIDYGGWYFTNMNIPQNACARLIKRYDSRAHCEEQPSPDEFYIVADKRIPQTPFEARRNNLVDIWHELINIRVKP